MNRHKAFPSGDGAAWVNNNCFQCKHRMIGDRPGCSAGQLIAMAAGFSGMLFERTLEQVGWTDGKINDECKMKEAV